MAIWPIYMPPVEQSIQSMFSTRFPQPCKFFSHKCLSNSLLKPLSDSVSNQPPLLFTGSSLYKKKHLLTSPCPLSYKISNSGCFTWGQWTKSAKPPPCIGSGRGLFIPLKNYVLGERPCGLSGQHSKGWEKGQNLNNKSGSKDFKVCTELFLFISPTT